MNILRIKAAIKFNAKFVIYVASKRIILQTNVIYVLNFGQTTKYQEILENILPLF